MINALSPLDGRYEPKIQPLRMFFSEEALIKYRLIVEILYFQTLCNEKSISDLPALKVSDRNKLDAIIENFSEVEAKKVKAIEKKTNHDVKAVEYYLKQQFEKIPALKKYKEFVHFGLTSEDVNNLAYGMMISDALKFVVLPELKKLDADLRRLSSKWRKVSLLSLTHGQPATPSTIGNEFAVFSDRLSKQVNKVKSFKMDGKFGGAVGNYSAHRAAYPNVKWEALGNKFVKSLGLTPLLNTTQINPHDDIAQLSATFNLINTILIDLSRDMWMYISRGIFKQKIIAGEVGSSTMPHKVNPIDFENAEGNLGLSNALFTHFANKLPISRLQRDLSDSTVQRNIGSAFGYHIISILSLKKGLSKIMLNNKATKKELDAHPEVYAEAIQMVLRKNNVEGAYEKLKALTRGENISKADLLAFVDTVALPKTEKVRLKKIIG
ncbi:MAG: adenylosuccinate lyase [Candidatus Peribacteraceae bacterium]|nr:adenylosuccinate lyase [Candidatus Peribacteraceae bacterium]